MSNTPVRTVLGCAVGALVVADALVLVGLAQSPPAEPAPSVPAPVLTPPPSSEPSLLQAPAPRTTRSHPTTTTRVRPSSKSPFADRCRTGQIPAWLCRDIP